MLCVARLMIEAALAREESRGAHVRTDFPADRRRALEPASFRFLTATVKRQTSEIAQQRQLGLRCIVEQDRVAVYAR